MSNGRMIPVNRSARCVICGGDHKCSRKADGLILCGRPVVPAPSGFVHLGQANGNETFSLYRHVEDLQRQSQPANGRPAPPPPPPPPPLPPAPPPAPPVDWRTRAAQYAAALTPELRLELAQVLGLPEVAVAMLPMLGWHDGEQAWTMPEFDAGGTVVGVNRRFRDGDKRVLPGGSRGLTVLKSWDQGGTIWIVEGASDALALHAAGLTAIGQPNNYAGQSVEQLAGMVRDIDPSRAIVVVGEYDVKDDGKWPGRDGAVKTATALMAELNRRVAWCFPPDKAKDSRAWARTRITDREDMDAWADAGAAFASAVKVNELKAEAAADVVRPTPFRDLIRSYPTMRPPIVHGLLRDGETMNVIAAPKVGKSWLTVGLAFAVAAGRPWLGFGTVKGRVQIIDNELHEETIAGRLKRIAEAYGHLDDIDTHVDVVSLRGRLRNIRDLGSYLRAIEPGYYSLTIIDAWYRTLPDGLDENDNAAVAGLYNLLDSYAKHLRCGFVLIHHASKGNQASKGVTDVGSGAGSQSRAADTHLVLRPHEEDNVVVMEAAVRSFPPVAPKCLRWAFPTFTPTGEFDPSDLLRPNQKRAGASATGITDERRILARLDEVAPDGACYGMSKLQKDVEVQHKIGRTAFENLIHRLILAGTLVQCRYEQTIGSRATRAVGGVRRHDTDVKFPDPDLRTYDE